MKNKLSFTVFTPANFVTFAGMLLTLLSYILISKNASWLSLGVFTTAALTDALDGFVAKNKTIQSFFGGRGQSQLGSTMDLIRDWFLKMSIFVLAWVSGISLIYPTIIAAITIGNLVFINRPLNAIVKKIVVLEAGRMLQILECIVIGVWLLACVLHANGRLPVTLPAIAMLILGTLCLTNLTRTKLYSNELRKRRKAKPYKSIF